MPRTTNSTFTTEKNATTNKPIHLYTIHNYNGSSDLTYAEYDTDVTFNSIVYSAFPLSFDSISENNSGGVDEVTISVGNVSRAIQVYLEMFEFRGLKVTIKTVWSNQLADADAYIDDVYFIDSYTVSDKSAIFRLTSKLDLLNIQLPNRRYTRNHCAWRYKGTECAATSAEATCNKTKADCKIRNNYDRFGGFPSVQPNKVIIG